MLTLFPWQPRRPVPAPTLSGAQLVIDGQRARFGLEHSEQVTAAKAAAATAAAKARQAAKRSGSPRQIAGQTLRQFGWPRSQFSCLEPLWERESGWY